MEKVEPTPEQWTAAIAMELTLAQKEAGITNVRLSQDTGIVYQSLGRYLRGDREMGNSTFIVLCRGLGVSPADIWKRAGARLAND